MKKLLAAFVLLFGISAIVHAGTPMETGGVFQGQGNLSGTTIIGSTATTTSIGNYSLVVPTPTVVNSGGGTYQGRNCFTKFVVQIPTTTVVTIADNFTTKWTIYGSGLGASGVNTLTLAEDHLGPYCTAAGDQTTITLTNTAGPATAASFNYEGYTVYGGIINQGPMY